MECLVGTAVFINISKRLCFCSIAAGNSNGRVIIIMIKGEGGVSKESIKFRVSLGGGRWRASMVISVRVEGLDRSTVKEMETAGKTSGLGE